MSYVGPERRIHKVYVTRNTEYHVRRSVCVAVRDRPSGRWIPSHRAVGLELTGAMRTAAHDGPVVVQRLPEPGERLCLGDMVLVTSPLEQIRRPPREVVVSYPLERSA